MVLEGLRGYLQIASGLSEVTRQRALAVAKAMAVQGESGLGAMVTGDLRDQVASIAEDLVATSRANRDLLLGVVGSEVERQVARLGLVSADELQAATARADRLERRLRDVERQLAQAGEQVPARTPSTAEKSTAKKSTAKKSTAKKSTAKKSTAKKSTAEKSAARKSAASTTTATTRRPSSRQASRTPSADTAAPAMAPDEAPAAPSPAELERTREAIARAQQATVRRVTSQKEAVQKATGKVPSGHSTAATSSGSGS